MAKPSVLGEDALAPRQTFQADLGNISQSTFFRYLKDGRIPQPDAWIGCKACWRVSTIRKVVDQFVADRDTLKPEIGVQAGPGRPRKDRAVTEGASQGGAA